MISVIIPTLDAANKIETVLISLMPGVLSGVIKEVIVSDGGDCPQTSLLCDAMGAVFISGEAGRGVQLAHGAKHALSDWLLFLHVDTALEEGWERDVGLFLSSAEKKKEEEEDFHEAAFFAFALEDEGIMPRLVEKGVKMRCRVLGLPYGDQGLLISRTFYNDIGGFTGLPLMEDVDINRRIGAKRLLPLEAKAFTSAERYRKDGYFRRVSRNTLCIMLYFAGFSPQTLHKIYNGAGKN